MSDNRRLPRGVRTTAAARKRVCPVCGSNEAKHLFRQSFEQLSGVGFLDGYDVVVCARCGFGFADGIPSQPVFDAYYRDLSKYENAHREGSESEEDHRRFRDIAAVLTKFIPSRSSKVLEIGCATGRLLSVVRDAGYADVEGIDPSPGCAQAARELYKVRVRAGSLFDVSALPESYDFVILIGVLEHIEDLKTALASIWRSLTPEGRVYAEVPDGSRLAGRPDAPYQEFSTEHINFFSTTSLTNLFRTNGFEEIFASKAIRQQNANTTIPAAFGIYSRGHGRPIEYDDTTEPGLRRYIEESAGVDLRVQKVIEDSALGREIVVWGTGTHTQRLLAAGAFMNVRIAAFVDSNPKFQGRTLSDILVIGPEALHQRSEPILISSRGFQREIRDQIRDELNLPNEIIVLYDDD